MRQSLCLLSVFLLIIMADNRGAQAHPHVWVAVRSEIVFGDDGQILGLRHAWEFD